MSYDYEEPPQDPEEEEMFYWIMEGYRAAGHAVAFGPGSNGKPAGYRESQPGRWQSAGLLTRVSDFVIVNSVETRAFLAVQGFEFFDRAYGSDANWIRGWIDEIKKNPDIVSDAIEPAELEKALSTSTGAWRILMSLEIPENYKPMPIAGPADYDPVRGDRIPRPPVKIETAEPYRYQTRRRVYQRTPDGKFAKGGVSIVTVPTLEIPYSSRLGSRIRAIDIDGSRKRPRGAIARIETRPKKSGHPAHYVYFVPVDKNGKFRGGRVGDKRHLKRQDERQAVSIQLEDHRTRLPRKMEVLITAKSKNFELVAELAEQMQRAL